MESDSALSVPYAAAGVLCGCPLLTALPAAGADAAAGRDKAAQCAACHGADGNSTLPSVPRLAGQRADYIVSEMQEFRSGRRQDPVMSAIAQAVQDPTDLADIAAYYASQTPARAGRVRGPRFAQGERLFFEERCMYCHGERAEGGLVFDRVLQTAATLAGQHATYLGKALRDIRDGKRPADPYGLMERSLKRLSEEQLDAIAEFLASL